MIRLGDIKKISILLLLLFLAQAIDAENGGGFVQVFDGKLKRADRYYDNFEYSAAIKLYEKVLQKDANNNLAKLRLAESYRKINDRGNAEKWYATVIDDTEIIEPIHKYNYAQLLISAGKYDAARQWMMAYNNEVSQDKGGQNIIYALNNLDSYYIDSAAYTLEQLPVNSDGSDFAPAFYKEGIVFVSSRKNGTKKFKWDESSFLDLYYFKVNDAVTISKPVAFSSKINSQYHEGPVSFYDQDRRMIFTRSNYHEGNLGVSSDGVNNLQLYSAELDESGNDWTNIKPLSFNQSEYSTGHPSVSADGQRLYFASDMPGGFGGTDIYVSQRQGDQWGSPQNLGKEINTFGNEMYPYLHPSNIIYFSSNGHGGFGGLDVFSKDLDDLNDPVKNLGHPINSNQDDFGFIVDEDRRQGFISTNRNGNDDILQVTINRSTIEPIVVDNQSQEPLRGGNSYDPALMADDMNSKPAIDRHQAVSISGLVVDQDSHQPIKDAVVKLYNNGEQVEVDYSLDDGRIHFDAAPGNDYILVAQKDQYVDQILTIPAASITDHEAQEELLMVMERTDENNEQTPASPNHVIQQASIHDAIADHPIKAKITNKETGELLTNAEIKLFVDDPEQAVNYEIKDGELILDAEAGKNYMIIASHPGHKDRFINLSGDSLISQNTHLIAIELPSVDSIEEPTTETEKIVLNASVTDQRGSPVDDVDIKLFVNGTAEEVGFSNQRGRIHFKPTQGKDYMVMATKANYQDLIYHLPAKAIDGKEHDFELSMMEIESTEDHVVLAQSEGTESNDPSLVDLKADLVDPLVVQNEEEKGLWEQELNTDEDTGSGEIPIPNQTADLEDQLEELPSPIVNDQLQANDLPEEDFWEQGLATEKNAAPTENLLADQPPVSDLNGNPLPEPTIATANETDVIEWENTDEPRNGLADQPRDSDQPEEDLWEQDLASEKNAAPTENLLADQIDPLEDVLVEPDLPISDLSNNPFSELAVAVGNETEEIESENSNEVTDVMADQSPAEDLREEDLKTEKNAAPIENLLADQIDPLEDMLVEPDLPVSALSNDPLSKPAVAVGNESENISEVTDVMADQSPAEDLWQEDLKTEKNISVAENLEADQIDPSEDVTMESDVTATDLMDDAGSTPAAGANKIEQSVVEPKSSTTLKAQAIDSETLTNLENTEVKLYADRVEQPADYQAGTLTFDAIPGKEYSMLLSNPGYRDILLEIPMEVVQAENPEEIAVALQKATVSEASGEIAPKYGDQTLEEKTVQLVDLQGEPMTDATAQLFVDGEEERTIYPSDQGSFEVASIPEVEQQLVIKQPGRPNQILSIDPASWEDTHTLVVPYMDPKRIEPITFSYLKESGQWEKAEVVVIEDLRGENKTYLSTDERLYEVVKEGANNYLVNQDQKILLPDPQPAKDTGLEDQMFYNSLPDEDKLLVDQVINQQLKMQSPDDLPLETVEAYYQNLTAADQTAIDHLISEKAQVLDLPDPKASSKQTGTSDPILSHLLEENHYNAAGAVRINNIYYDFDRSGIRADARAELEKLVNLLQQHQDLKLAMSSHTDVRGSSSYNVALSKRRAQAAKDYLLDHGINPDRLLTESYGEDQPINDCINGKSCSESEHKLNRRTEFRLITSN